MAVAALNQLQLQAGQRGQRAELRHCLSRAWQVAQGALQRQMAQATQARQASQRVTPWPERLLSSQWPGQLQRTQVDRCA